MNTLERKNKHRDQTTLQSEINSLNQSVYGDTTNSYPSSPNHTTYEKFSTTSAPQTSSPNNFSRLPESYKKYSESFTRNLNNNKLNSPTPPPPPPVKSKDTKPKYDDKPKLVSVIPKKSSHPNVESSFEYRQNGNSNNTMSTYSSNYEIINEPPVVVGNETLEQRMCKKSITQKIVEKRTVTMSQSKHGSTTTKSFQFQD